MADKSKKQDKQEQPKDNSGPNVRADQRAEYDQKNPNPNDLHSDDPLIAGLANGQRNADVEDGKDEPEAAGPVR